MNHEDRRHPTRPFWKDEQVTRWLTTSNALALFVVVNVAAALAFCLSGIVIIHEVAKIQAERRSAHTQAAADRRQVTADLQRGADDRRRLRNEFDKAICTILDSYLPPPVTPGGVDPLRQLRLQHGCSVVPKISAGNR